VEGRPRTAQGNIDGNNKCVQFYFPLNTTTYVILETSLSSQIFALLLSILTAQGNVDEWSGDEHDSRNSGVGWGTPDNVEYTVYTVTPADLIQLILFVVKRSKLYIAQEFS